jgi:hypothetical protein
MIRYALVCDCEAEFESWFASSEAYDRLAQAGQLACVACGGSDVRKQIMAPAVARRDRAPADPEAMMTAFAAKVRAQIASTHTYVGDDFASQALAMHEGEAPERPIWGSTTPEERETLAEAGVPAAPLPAPFVPPIPEPPKALN